MADGLTPEELREFEMITLELQRRGGGIFDEMVVASLGQPQPGPQVKILEAVHDGAYPRVGCGGARGGGKSWILRRAMIERRILYPQSRGLILRRTYEELWGNHILPLLKALPRGTYSYNASLHRMVFSNGSIQEFGYCKTDQDVLRYHGQEYDDIAIDEVEQWRETWFDQLTGSCRTTRRDLKPVMLCSFMPGGVGHGWVKRRWVDKDFHPHERPNDYIFVRANVWDNPALTEADPNYVLTLQSLPDDLRRAWLEGDFDVFAGQYFSELRWNTHGFVGDPPDGWDFVCMDYGERAPCAAYWVRVDHSGELWFWKEFYETGVIYSELKKRLRDLSVDAEGRPLNVRYTMASPDIFTLSRGTGVVGAEILSSKAYEGFSWPVAKADSNRVEGWRTMKEWIHSARIHVHTENCPHWWRTVPSLIYDEKKTEDVDPDCEDHAGEATRYGLMSRPRPSRLPKPRIEPYSAQWAEKRMVATGKEDT